MTDQNTQTSQKEKSSTPPYEIGEFVPKKGVYFGVWEPINSSGRSLKKTFHVFAAPYDLGLNKKGQGIIVRAGWFKDASNQLSLTRKLLGHDGAKIYQQHYYDEAIFKALEKETYKGEWFIPPLELLNGHDRLGQKVQHHNLYDYREKGALRGTFEKLEYWSHTPAKGYSSPIAIDFTNGENRYENCHGYDPKAIRPIRAELIKK